MARKRNSDSNAVGYRRPPTHTQWKKGQSGNPRGRPKRDTLDAILEHLLDRRVTVRVGNTTRRITLREHILQEFLGKAAEGHAPTLKLVLAELRRQDERATESDSFDAADREVIDALYRRIADDIRAPRPEEAAKPPAKKRAA